MFPHRRSDDDHRSEKRRQPPPPPGPAPALYPPSEPATGQPDRPDRPDQPAQPAQPAQMYDWEQPGPWPPVAPGPAPTPATAPGGRPGPQQPGPSQPGPQQPGPSQGRPQSPAQHAQHAQHAPPSPPAQHPAPPLDDFGRYWHPMVIDGVVPDFTPRPPGRVLSYRPDTVCDGWSTPALDLRLASVRGYAHRVEGRPREDDAAASWDETTGTVVFAVADGVSDASQPHIGSQLACRSAVDELLAQVRASGGLVTDWPKLLGTVHWQLREQATRLLRGRDATVDETADLLATTLVAGAATPTRDGVHVALISVGDSGAWAIKYQELYPLQGGKRAGADGLVSSVVQPMPYVPADARPAEFRLDPGTVLLVGTDGFGDPVGDGRGKVARLFANELATPVPPLAFAYMLDFYRETFDDDRTLLALWPRAAGPGGPR